MFSSLSLSSLWPSSLVVAAAVAVVVAVVEVTAAFGSGLFWTRCYLLAAVAAEAASAVVSEAAPVAVPAGAAAVPAAVVPMFDCKYISITRQRVAAWFFVLWLLN
ncbi:exported hypothetical protein [Lacticaseibacillus paracasei]|nr:exported hypothetical protein [Lacticaseibacillus paracasei]